MGIPIGNCGPGASISLSELELSVASCPVLSVNQLAEVLDRLIILSDSHCVVIKSSKSHLFRVVLVLNSSTQVVIVIRGGPDCGTKIRD